MDLKHILCGIFLLSFLCSAASAAENVSASRSLMSKGPSGVLVSLGLDTVMPLADSYVWYNWMSVIMLFTVGAISTRVNTRFVMILLPLMAGMLVFFGWLNATNASTTWGVIVVMGIMGAVVYMKGSLKENFGIGGPGNTIFNIVTYLIILQAVVGFVNTSAIWDNNTAMDSQQYLNVDLSEQVTTVNGMGGFFNDIQDIGSILLNAGINVLRFVLTMVASVVVFAVVLAQIFPWIGATPLGVAFLVVLQTAIWICYIMLVFSWFFKPSLDAGYL